MKKITLYNSITRKENPIKAYSIIKNNNEWLVYIPKCNKKEVYQHTYKGFYIIPKCIYLYTWYIPKNSIDAIKRIFKK